jgi:hypothetical protein
MLEAIDRSMSKHGSMVYCKPVASHENLMKTAIDTYSRTAVVAQLIS